MFCSSSQSSTSEWVVTVPHNQIQNIGALDMNEYVLYLTKMDKCHLCIVQVLNGWQSPCYQ